MYIPFPHEVTALAAQDYEFAKAIKDSLEEVSPRVERQELYFRIAYPIMWVSFLALACYMTRNVNWWFGYAMLVFFTLSAHLSFRWIYRLMMSRLNTAEKFQAYYASYILRTYIVCIFTMGAIGALISVAYLVHALTPLMEQKDKPAVVQTVEAQPADPAALTNANTTASQPVPTKQ